MGAAGRCTGIDGVTRACCGDGELNPNEQCDGDANAACPGACRSDCTCPGTAPAPLDLGVAADTYIEAGGESTWDHGTSDHLDVDLAPFGVAYLRFDLRAVTAPIRSAVLRLSCSNASEDGGTVYAVADSSWIEGTQPGASGASAAGPGLNGSRSTPTATPRSPPRMRRRSYPISLIPSGRSVRSPSDNVSPSTSAPR